MMKRWFTGSLFCMVVLLFPLGLLAQDYLTQADALYDQGAKTKLGIENVLNSIPLYIKAVEASPDSYEANWKCARAHREYADKAHKQNVEGWEKICKKYGKEGMKYGEKAAALAPDKIEGHFYYGLCVGVYSDGVSILTALKEGLKGKTQTAFEKSYEIDKMFDEGSPVIALGRFWSVLPWPLKKNKKAITYLRENLQLCPEGIHKAEAQNYLAEVLLNTGGKDEAKTLLDEAASITGTTIDDNYFRDYAKDLLAKMK